MTTIEQQAKINQAIGLERDAHRLRGEGKIEQSFQTFDQAARLFKESGEHLKSAVCYASAATCWNIHVGWQPLKNAATRTEAAALQAFQAGDYAYAESLFSEAALLYEKEGDFTKYSYCYEHAKKSHLRFFWNALIGRDQQSSHPLPVIGSFKEKAVLSFRCLLSFMSGVIWGHGERPFRTFWIACGTILLSALIYRFSGLVLVNSNPQEVNFFESLYLSIITYSTVGFGDYLPSGWIRAVSAFEALCGITLTPLFLIALTRRYLRVSR